MQRQALFFGSIGTLVETSELQRQAFNTAFAEAGLSWKWDKKTYSRLLERSGGELRIQEYAKAVGDTVDAAALHSAKVEHFAQIVSTKDLTLRPGVRSLIDDAHERGIIVGFVTDTVPKQVLSTFDAVGSALQLYDFAYIGDATKVLKRKPFPDIYADALETLNIAQENVIAIEDTATSGRAALASGIETVIVPGDMVQDHNFPADAHVLDALTPDILEQQKAA